MNKISAGVYLDGGGTVTFVPEEVIRDLHLPVHEKTSREYAIKLMIGALKEAYPDAQIGELR